MEIWQAAPDVLLCPVLIASFARHYLDRKAVDFSTVRADDPVICVLPNVVKSVGSGSLGGNMWWTGELYFVSYGVLNLNLLRRLCCHR